MYCSIILTRSNEKNRSSQFLSVLLLRDQHSESARLAHFGSTKKNFYKIHTHRFDVCRKKIFNLFLKAADSFDEINVLEHKI